MDLSQDHWRRASHAEREAIARQLAAHLPSGFSFHSIEHNRLGERDAHNALFHFNDATFALIPGATVSLGYSADRPWQANADEQVSWQGTAAEMGCTESLPEYIAAVTLRSRHVELGPFLIETVTHELGWETIGLDDPEVKELSRDCQLEKRMEVHRDDTITRVSKDSASTITAQRSVPRTHAELAAQLGAEGFRFPTSEQWEYACGAGAATLFRWGDHVPCDRYPTDMSPAEAAWRRQWVLSSGKLPYPTEGFAFTWDQHRRPNAFGLDIASDPYQYELLAEPGSTRGGDGGSMICGGAGFFVGWLTLATAYFEAHSCSNDPAEPIAQGYTIGRSVLDLNGLD